MSIKLHIQFDPTTLSGYTFIIYINKEEAKYNVTQIARNGNIWIDLDNTCNRIT